MHKQFRLQQPDFSDDSDVGQIPDGLIEMYNRQYSLILGEAKNFFADCKDFLTRSMALNNMGIGFNLPILFSSIIKVECDVINFSTNKEHAFKRKEKLQNSFAKIIQKMGKVIEEMLNFQIKIKREYLGEAFGQAHRPCTRVCINKTERRQLKSDYENNKRIEKEENKLRQIFQKNMIPLSQKVDKVCDLLQPVSTNADGLIWKIQKLKQQILATRKKQQKIWKIFDEKRPSRAMFEDVRDNIEQQQKQKQYKQLSDMLSDIVSQKNHMRNSPFDTVDSSIY